MKSNWVLGMAGLCVGLVGPSARADDPTGLPMYYQPPAATQPRPVPPTTPTTPGGVQPSPLSPTLAPVTDTFAQAPRTGSAAIPGFQPFMIGDLGVGGVFARGYITLPGHSGQRPSSGNNGSGGSAGGPVQSRVVPIPATGRGSFKITENESPRPIDRFFLTYNYFNGIGSGVPNFPTFDLHRETFGFEKTFFGGDASVEMRINTLQAAGDGSLRSSDFGDMTFVSKFALINDPGGNVVSVGMAVTVPTGPDLILLDGSRLNPVLIQPYTGFIYVMDDWFAQGFSSLIFPTDSRDIVLSVGSVAVGWQMYRAADQSDSLISYITPTLEGHATIPLNHRGLNNSTGIGFPDLLVITNGIHFGLGRMADLTLGVAVPVTGPKLFDMEAMALLNFRF